MQRTKIASHTNVTRDSCSCNIFCWTPCFASGSQTRYFFNFIIFFQGNAHLFEELDLGHSTIRWCWKVGNKNRRKKHSTWQDSSPRPHNQGRVFYHCATTAAHYDAILIPVSSRSPRPRQKPWSGDNLVVSPNWERPNLDNVCPLSFH